MRVISPSQIAIDATTTDVMTEIDVTTQDDVVKVVVDLIPRRYNIVAHLLAILVNPVIFNTPARPVVLVIRNSPWRQ